MDIWSWTESFAEGLKHRSNGVSAQHSEIMNLAEEGILIFAADGACQFLNASAKAFLEGVAVENLDSFLRLVQGKSESYSQTENENGSIASVLCIVKLNGRTLRMRAGRVADGGMSVFMSNITESVSFEKTIKLLKQDKKEVELAVEAMASGVAVCCRYEGRGVIRIANKLFHAMTDTMPETVFGIELADLLQDTVGADAAALKEAMLEGKDITLEWRRDFPDAPPQWYEVSLKVLKDADEGMSGCYACFLSDVTAIHVQKAQLFQSQKLEALGQLAGGVAHDFNNLLSIVDGYARMAVKHIDKDNPAYNYLERIKQANRRGASLTKQLLTFGRHKIVAESVVDIGALLTDQEPLLRPLLNASVGLMVMGEDGLYVDCAADGIAQVLINLVINARDAMPEGGSIIIEAEAVEWTDLPLNVALDRRRDKYVRLSVEDTGTGMDHETQMRIFDPFFTTKAQGKGTGLGLSMVYGIVQQIGGVIDVWSRPGEGTAMRIYLPLSDKEPMKKSIVRNGANGGAKRFDGYTALIAEDEKDLLFVVGSMLEDMGIKVIKAADGNEALLMQEDYNGEIDFLLTDVVMPELNGVRLAEMMEEVRPDTKILFMSGYPANGSMAQVQLPEDAWLLAKPVEFEKLADVLEARLQDNAQENMAGTRGMYHWRSAGGS